jgi:hypothetical protein
MLMHQYVELSHVYDDRVVEDDELDDDSATAPPSTAHTGSSADATSSASAATSEAEPLAQIADDAGADPVPEDEISDLALDAATEDTRARAGDTGGAFEASIQAAGGTRPRSGFFDAYPCAAERLCPAAAVSSVRRNGSSFAAASPSPRSPFWAGSFLRRATSLVGPEF